MVTNPVSAVPIPASSAGQIVVLVAEDDVGVRLLIWSALREQGYAVLHARDGVDALAVAREHGGPIDLLLTDVEMPAIPGCQLYHSLLAQRPHIKTVFLSGGVSEPSAGTLFLRKPFNLAALFELINRAANLAGSGGAEPPLNVCADFQGCMGERCDSCPWALRQ